MNSPPKKEAPKKFLEITNLVYVLPDDFQGTIYDALPILMKYLEEALKNQNLESPKDASSKSVFENLVISGFNNSLSARFVFHEFDEASQLYLSKPEIVDTHTDKKFKFELRRNNKNNK